jgi:hypothetical protein
VIACIETLMQHDTAGDPMSGLKWTRKTTSKIAAELQWLDIHVSDRTVARLLKQMDFALRVNHKKLSGASAEDRDAQFTHIAEVRERFAAQGLPLISIDTKKKELVGRFQNAGASWERQPVLVNDHDFRSDASGIAIPYGIYDLRANRGTVFVGHAHDTPEFAVECVETWWRTEGRQRHHDAAQLAILADGGGSNAANSRTSGSTDYKPGCAIALGSPSPSPITRPAPRSGIPSNTGCSAKSARTGRAALWTATRPFSNASKRPPPPPAFGCKPTSSRRPTRKGSRSPMPKCASSILRRTRSFRNATTPSAFVKMGSYYFAST